MKIKLYNDVVFKWIFGRQEQTYPLICFLNSVVSYDADDCSKSCEDCKNAGDYKEYQDKCRCRPKFSEVKILNPYDVNEPFTIEKQGILDIRAKDVNTHEWIDLEVQVVRKSDYRERSKYYLAGMYRDQLKKGNEHNYDELRACYGIHLLVDSIFEEKGEEEFWFNHYRMLNIRTNKPLMNHWNLYYIELNKFFKCFEKRQFSKNIKEREDISLIDKSDKNQILFGKELELWSYFLGTIQDNSKPLTPALSVSKGIKEVFDMLQTFTKDDRLREQYRLHEEFIRVQKGDEAKKKKLQEQYKEAMLELEELRKAKEEERRAKEKERTAKEKERTAKEEERRAKEEALKRNEEIIRVSVLSLKQAGYSNDKISLMLNIPLKEVENI